MPPMKNMNIKEAWIVDDDDVFIFVFREVIKKCSNINSFKSFTHQDAALQDLKKRKDSGSGLPQVIFCDLRLSFYTALDFIEDVKIMGFQEIPKIVCITVSSHPKDIEKIKAANIPYLIKPVKPKEIQQLLDQLF